MQDFLSNYLSEIIAGVTGGLVGAGLNEAARYVVGWRNAGQNKGADFHIAATMYPAINPDEPTHQAYLPALEDGKTHVQELLWLGSEIPLHVFLSNRYIYHQAISAMSGAKNAGLLLGEMPEKAERQIVKKIIGYHNSIPNNSIVQYYREHISGSRTARIKGISPPTHEHYDGSAHRKVLRAMFIADKQLKNGLPPEDKIYFGREGRALGNRYKTLTFLINEYHKNPELFQDTHVYF